MSEPIVAGLFVGGGSRRMGRPKGLLPAPDGSTSLVQRLAEQVRLALGSVPVVLVGQRAEYEHLPFAVVPDARPDRGPLGGLVALLRHAEAQGAVNVIALACDHPFLGASLIRRLAEEHPDARVCCPSSEGRAEPLVARYSIDVLTAFEQALAKEHLSLQPLLRAAGASHLELDASERQSLVDWDTPEEAGLI